jgi:hypothetical protein
MHQTVYSKEPEIFTYRGGKRHYIIQIIKSNFEIRFSTIETPSFENSKPDGKIWGRRRSFDFKILNSDYLAKANPTPENKDSTK